MKNNYILVIDDTGFNTNQKKSEYLKTQESCFCSVIISENDAEQISKVINIFGKRLNSKYNQTEFHFTDMYNRKGNFANISIEETLDIADTFAQLFKHFNLEVVVSTINKDSYSKNQQALMQAIQNILLPKLNWPKDLKSINLLLNILRAKREIETCYGDNAKLTKVICDEGVLKAGRTTCVELTGGKIDICFESSNKNNLLQMADFSAWLLTRSKHIFDKPKQSIKEWDNQMLKIYSQIDYINLEKENYNFKDETFSYDKTINNLTK